MRGKTSVKKTALKGWHNYFFAVEWQKRRPEVGSRFNWIFFKSWFLPECNTSDNNNRKHNNICRLDFGITWTSFAKFPALTRWRSGIQRATNWMWWMRQMQYWTVLAKGWDIGHFVHFHYNEMSMSHPLVLAIWPNVTWKNKFIDEGNRKVTMLLFLVCHSIIFTRIGKYKNTHRTLKLAAVAAKQWHRTHLCGLINVCCSLSLSPLHIHSAQHSSAME